MSRPTRPWLRIYVEMARDMKIQQLSPPQKWLWVAVLMATRESPISGKLMLSNSLAVDEQTLSYYAGMRVQDVKKGMQAMQQLGLIEWDKILGAWSVPRWSDRQYESDDVNKRTAKFRSQERDRNVPKDDLATTFRGPRDRDRDRDRNRVKEVFKGSKDPLNPSLQTQGKCDEPENPVEDLANSASRNEPKYVQIPTAEKQDPQDPVAETIPKAQPLPISAVPAVDISAPKSLTPSGGKATKARKTDLLFEAIAEVCEINWRSTTESELVLVGKSRREIGNTADGTPDEVRRKAAIYHRMFPNMTLTPMALVKHWSRLEEKNIPKTSAELKNEHLERTFASYRIPVIAQEDANDENTGGSGGVDVKADSSSDAMETAFSSDSTPGPSRRDATVESQASRHADTSSPQSPAMGRQNAPDTDSGRRLGFEYGFQPNGSQNTSNRSTEPLTGKSEVPPESLTPNGSLTYVDRTEHYVAPSSEGPSDLVLDADAERRRIAAKSLISEFAKQKQMAVPKSDGPVLQSHPALEREIEPTWDEPDWDDADIEAYEQDPTW